jgi:hypothetical protein
LEVTRWQIEIATDPNIRIRMMVLSRDNKETARKAAGDGKVADSKAVVREVSAKATGEIIRLELATLTNRPILLRKNNGRRPRD